MADVKYVASCSWGKDSTAMILKLLEQQWPLNEVIFYDTGMEFEAVYRVRDQIVPFLQDAGILYTELHPPRPFLYDMLVHPKRKRATGLEAYGNDWCGKCRWGTCIKQRVCDRYTGREDRIYLGLAADEPGRLEKLDDWKCAPLAVWGMTETDCLSYCTAHGIRWIQNNVDLYAILDRVSCWCCQNKNLQELYHIWWYLPDVWAQLKGLQSRIPEPFKGPGKSIFDLEQRFLTGTIYQKKRKRD